MDEDNPYATQFGEDSNIRIRDVEEKQRILRDRVLLIAQNLVEIKERNNERILEIKKDIEKIKQEMDNIKIFLENFSGEFSKFAKKEDVEVLARQAKMFQPLEFVRKSELKEFGN